MPARASAPPPPLGPVPAGASAATAGGRRISSAAGTITITAPMAIHSMALRHPYVSIRRLANGVITIGATPPPTDTSDTARLRCLSNQPSVVEMIGAKKAPPAAPTMPP